MTARSVQNVARLKRISTIGQKTVKNAQNVVNQEMLNIFGMVVYVQDVI
jgi:hypothetical protein